MERMVVNKELRWGRREEMVSGVLRIWRRASSETKNSLGKAWGEGGREGEGEVVHVSESESE